MDAKITRKRLSDFLAYEWIVMIVAVLVAVLLWEALFSLTAVRLSPGQTYYILYGSGVVPKSNLAEESKEGVFSYDVIGGVIAEDASYETAVLFAKIDTFIADALITTTSRAAHIIDNRKVCDLDTLYLSAKEYVGYFYDGDAINAERVAEKFSERMKNDNRFKTESEKAEGVLLEVARIEKLKKDVSDLGAFLESAREEEFYRYTRFYNTYENAAEENKESYRDLYEKEIAEGREDLKYGLAVSELSGGEHDPTEYFKKEDETEQADEKIVILLFDQRTIDGKENVLFYENASFICKILKLCSNYIA